MANKPRNYSSKFKAKVVLEVISGKRSVSEASRAHKVHSSVINRWRGVAELRDESCWYRNITKLEIVNQQPDGMFEHI